MFAPDALEFSGGVVDNLLLDVLDIALVELGRFAILEDHEAQVLFVGEAETCENL